MLGRYLVPLTLLTIVLAVLASMLWLSLDPSAQLAWWINQEAYARVRGLIYLLDDASIRPSIAIMIGAALGLLCFLFRTRRSVCFMANHAALIATFYAAFSEISVKAAALGDTPVTRLHILLGLKWDTAVLLAFVAALVACLPCHLDYLMPGWRVRR